MVERKLFKTKLCELYKRGRCTRHSCSFAHGQSELRRFPASSFHGRHGFEDRDLRGRLDRRHSSERIYSPVRYARGRNLFHDKAAESSPSTSLEKQSERKHRKKRRVDGQSDISGSLRISVGADHQSAERNFEDDSRDVLIEQLRKAQVDINRFDHQKAELQVKFEERVQEVDSLTSKIQELETQLNKEKEENQRILSKINRFVKVHNRHSEIQEKLKRSEVQLSKLGDELCSDIEKIGANEEDSSINVVSDDGAVGFPISPHKEKHLGISNKPQVESAKVQVEAPMRSEKVSRWNTPDQLNSDKEIEGAAIRNGQQKLHTNEKKHEARRIIDVSYFHKSTRMILPRVSMAAKAEDEGLEMESDALPVKGIKSFPQPLPPLPPLLKNKYSLYEGNDEDVTVDGDEDEKPLVDV